MKGKQTINRKIHCPKKVDPSLQKTNFGEQRRGLRRHLIGTVAPSSKMVLLFTVIINFFEFQLGRWACIKVHSVVLEDH